MAPGNAEGKLYELCLEDIWRNGVSPLFKLVVDLLLCRSGVEERRSGFRGLDVVEGTRAGDDRDGPGDEPLRCRYGVVRGVFAGDDSGSGVFAAVARF